MLKSFTFPRAKAGFHNICYSAQHRNTHNMIHYEPAHDHLAQDHENTKPRKDCVQFIDSAAAQTRLASAATIFLRPGLNLNQGSQSQPGVSPVRVTPSPAEANKSREMINWTMLVISWRSKEKLLSSLKVNREEVTLLPFHPPADCL